MHTHHRLSGKIAVVTGATGGIGGAIARRFGAEGATLVLAGRNRQRGRELTDFLHSRGTQCDFWEGDLAVDQDIDTLTDTVRRLHGRVDTLVLNAGTIAFGAICDITTDEFDDMMRINVRAPWLCVRTMLPLLSDGATIVVTASVSSFTIFPGEGVYCMTKAALIPMVQALAIELGNRNIRVNALCPGVVAEAGMSHDAFAASPDPAGEQAHSNALTPLGRPATLDEIADGAIYLASDSSSFMTGSSITLDGGITIPRV